MLLSLHGGDVCVQNMPSGSHASVVQGLPSSQVGGPLGSQGSRPAVKVVPKPLQFQDPDMLLPSVEAVPCSVRDVQMPPAPLAETAVPSMVPVRLAGHGETPLLKER